MPLTVASDLLPLFQVEFHETYENMTWITYFRLVVFGLAFILSFVMLALAGHMANTNSKFRGIVYDFQGLAIASAVLSLIGLAPLLVVGFLRKGAWINMNVVELPVIGFLWVFWFAEAILTTSWNWLYPDGCLARFNSITKTYCNELFAIEGLAFVVWIFLFAYIATMLIICLIGKSRGHAVWLVAADVPSYFEENPNEKNVIDSPSVYAAPAAPQQPSMQNLQASSLYPPQQPIQQPIHTGVQPQAYSPQMQQQNTGYSNNTTNSYAGSPAIPSGVAQV
ncbi:hypothetical protein D9758_003918 [Tetrapyrgos nigripes]|uniref:MARVEL domain-containing protein n=1 Tax=Tetrapyrgos nigripes TaxID=182062 RepID=A0A8H5GL71_9AGAR|nr:hypothetical protein D9758_003918 [Tetrapyrgos nigripes]